MTENDDDWVKACQVARAGGDAHKDTGSDADVDEEEGDNRIDESGLEDEGLRFPPDIEERSAARPLLHLCIVMVMINEKTVSSCNHLTKTSRHGLL